MAKNWEIRLKPQQTEDDPNKELEKTQEILIQTYGDDIKNVDFRLDTQQGQSRHNKTHKNVPKAKIKPSAII